jgi:hypothetical protein
MRPISYTLSYASSQGSHSFCILGRTALSTHGDNGFYILGKAIDQNMSRNSLQLPRDIAGINLTGKKYSNYNPPSFSKLSQKVSMVFQGFGLFVRARFSRYDKPIDHMGGASPEQRIPFYEHQTINDINRDMEIWPKVGTTFEDMDIFIN